MTTQINNELIRSFIPCYDPADVCEEKETLSVKEWIEKYRSKVKNHEDIIWLICRNDFMTDKDLRLFAVWCARTTYSLYESPDQIDPRSVNTIDTAERYANGEATEEELSAAWEAAREAAREAAWEAAWGAAREDAGEAAWEAARGAARGAQITQLLTYFK